VTDAQQPDPEPPRPPGAPDRDLLLPVETTDPPEVPDDEDVAPGAGTVEPPD
jgi:hypothetical protein